MLNNKIKNIFYMAILVFITLITDLTSFAENVENKTKNVVREKNKNKLDWYNSINKALDIAKKENKFILIDFCADWCEACKDLDKYTYSNEDVIKEIKANFITIKVDISKISNSSEIISKYNISSLPTILFFNKDINIPIDYKIIGFTKPEDFLKILKEVEKL